MVAEDRYILKRKIQAFGNTVLFMLCRIMPIQRNKIAVCTFEGKGGFGCNPKYIVEELHRRSSVYRFVWFVNDCEKEFPNYIRKVKNTAWNRIWHLATSKIWIDNYRKPYGTVKRKGQYYIQTWHATIGFKSIGLWRKDAFSKMAYLVSKNDSDMIDYVVTDSEWCDEMYPKGLVYNGEFLRVGAPRCDVLYGEREKERKKIRKTYGLAETDKIVMYAPTFRETQRNGKRSVASGELSIDFGRVLEAMENRFGGNWILFIRLHPQIAEKMKLDFNARIMRRIFDVSMEDDMSQLLAGVDAYITDYSSAAMDASFAGIPVFIYADDIGQYADDRGSMLWNFTNDSYVEVRNNKEITPGIKAILPYSIAQNNEELEQNIRNFQENAYGEKVKQFMESVNLVFDGRASQRIADIIEQCITK
ncbi:MAG: hypothetical protein HFH15_05735 [Ruminococcus sp.]|nr:hypothetical protein [Ruminococcus sp.]